MTIGTKIKSARLQKSMTQADLAGNHITRNMLSAIENDKANPSMDTVRYLADKLQLPVSYLLSDADDLSFYMKKELITDIKCAFSEKRYKDCILLIDKIESPDDELNYILAVSHFEIGAAAMRFGSMLSAKQHFHMSQTYCKSTVYDTSRYEATLPMYTAIVRNINTPLLEFDVDKYEELARIGFDYEFFKYLIGARDFSYTNMNYKMHLVNILKLSLLYLYLSQIFSLK